MTAARILGDLGGVCLGWAVMDLVKALLGAEASLLLGGVALALLILMALRAWRVHGETVAARRGGAQGQRR